MMTADGGKLTSRGRNPSSKALDKEPMLGPAGLTNSSS